jgi:D-aminopeptidase
MMGGLGSASLVRADGMVVGARAAGNAAGSVTIGDTPQFWAAPLEIGRAFGGLGWPAPGAIDPAASMIFKGGPIQSTTLGVIATDAALTKAELKRLAMMAQTGLARSIVPVHTPIDGDIVFALSVGERRLTNPVFDLTELGAMAASALARAVARGVYEAGGVSGAADVPAYRDAFPRDFSANPPAPH